ncbi:MAG TPA: surface-adhesin E family protein [Allosphingosinicella sp.]|nr:surface-adhesin E family protein [Allosphingosinicella sp.]
MPSSSREGRLGAALIGRATVLLLALLAAPGLAAAQTTLSPENQDLIARSRENLMVCEQRSGPSILEECLLERDAVRLLYSIPSFAEHDYLRLQDQIIANVPVPGGRRYTMMLARSLFWRNGYASLLNIADPLERSIVGQAEPSAASDLAELRYYLASALTRLGRADEALELLGRSASAPPGVTRGLLHLATAEAQAAQGNQSAAAAAANSAVREFEPTPGGRRLVPAALSQRVRASLHLNRLQALRGLSPIFDLFARPEERAAEYGLTRYGNVRTDAILELYLRGPLIDTLASSVAVLGGELSAIQWLNAPCEPEAATLIAESDARTAVLRYTMLGQLAHHRSEWARANVCFRQALRLSQRVRVPPHDLVLAWVGLAALPISGDFGRRLEYLRVAEAAASGMRDNDIRLATLFEVKRYLTRGQADAGPEAFEAERRSLETMVAFSQDMDSAFDRSHFVGSRPADTVAAAWRAAHEPPGQICTAGLACAVPIVSPALALPPDRWIRVSESENGTVWFIDSQRSEVQGDRRQAWFRLDHPASGTTRYRTTVRHDEIDCSAMRIRNISAVFHLPDGSSEEGPPSEYSFRDILPDSVLGTAARMVCRIQDPPAAN